jgi:hypothetical protein
MGTLLSSHGHDFLNKLSNRLRFFFNEKQIVRRVTLKKAMG